MAILRSIIVLIFLTLNTVKIFCIEINEKKPELKFILYYETYKPLILQQARLVTEPEKLSGRSDSLFVKYTTSAIQPDTISLNCNWEIPNHATLKLKFDDRERKSNVFYFDPTQKFWDVNVNDTALIVKPQEHFSFSDKNSYQGIVVLIQVFIEILLAFVIIKAFNWSLRLLLMVIAANIASFPVYLIHLPDMYLAELLAIVIETGIMMLIGLRKVRWWRIIIMVLLVNIISFGIKQVLFLVVKLL